MPFIDGGFRPALSGARFVTENPATGRPLAEIAAGDAADIDLAVRAARRAFDDGRWSRRAPAERKQVLLRFADLLEANLEELAMLDSLEAGKPITDCRDVDLPDTVRTFRWYAEAIDKVLDSVAPTGPDALGLVLREPIGVVGAVLPWNFPILMAAWKAAPALAAGNSLIIKPAELTSLSTIRMAELAAEAGLPDGVLNVVPGLGEAAGQALGRHMDVRSRWPMRRATGWRLLCTPRTSTRRFGLGGRFGPGRSRSIRTRRVTSPPRSVATRSRASAAATRASRHWTSTPRRRRSGSRSAADEPAQRAGALRASNPSRRASPTVGKGARFQANAVAMASQTGPSSQ